MPISCHFQDCEALLFVLTTCKQRYIKYIQALPDGAEIMTLALFVLIQYRRVADGWTDGQTRCDLYYPR